MLASIISLSDVNDAYACLMWWMHEMTNVPWDSRTSSTCQPEKLLELDIIIITFLKKKWNLIENFSLSVHNNWNRTRTIWELENN